MPAKKRSVKSNLKKVDRHRIAQAEYDDAPEITDAMLERAEVIKGGKVVKRGRSPLSFPED